MAPVTVVGRIRSPEVLDRHGRAAGLLVERGLRGPHVAGVELRIAWEALSEVAPLRFREGQRILVVLEPAPDWSLWRERRVAQGLLVIADRGRAWLDEPVPASVEALARFLRLGPAQRRSDPGAGALATLVVESQPELARAALDQLEREGAASQPAASALLGVALLDPERPIELRRAILELDVAGLRPLRPAIDRLAQGSVLELEALDAAARLDGGIAAEAVRELLARPDPRARELALRRAGSELSLAELEAILANDPAPSVRGAAVVVLAARPGPGALDAMAPALFDAESSVRTEAAARLGARGAEAVPLLLRLALEHGAPEAGGPVVALGLAGPQGREALVRIMSTHDDPRVRSLAALALGRPLPEP